MRISDWSSDVCSSDLNLWRIELLAKGLGCWVDMDFIFLRPVTAATPYLFGLEHEGWINNAVVHAPADSALVVDLQTRSEEHTSELQSLMRNSYAVFCLTKKTKQ